MQLIQLELPEGDQFVITDVVALQGLALPVGQCQLISS